MTPSPLAIEASRKITMQHAGALIGVPLGRLADALMTPVVEAAIRAAWDGRDESAWQRAHHHPLPEIYDEAAAQAVDYPCQMPGRPECCDLCPITPAHADCPHRPQDMIEDDQDPYHRAGMSMARPLDPSSAIAAQARTRGQAMARDPGWHLDSHVLARELGVSGLVDPEGEGRR